MSKNNAIDKELMKQAETACGFNTDMFADLIRADEREACAKLCETTPPWPFRPSIEAAHAIRARGKT